MIRVVNDHNINIQWASAFRQVLAAQPHQELTVPKLGQLHPLDMGFRSASGYPKGALAQYGLRTPEGGRFHVREYQTYFTVHRDWGDPDSGLDGLLIHLIRHDYLLGVVNSGRFSINRSTLTIE